MTPTDEVGAVGTAMRTLGVPRTVVDAIERLIRFHVAPAPTPPLSLPPLTGSRAEVGQLARQLHRLALDRTAQFGEAVNSITWNMLLDLAAADGLGRTVPISSLCAASGGPATTALRHLHRLEEQELIILTADPNDGRRVLVALTDKARAQLQQAILALRGLGAPA